MAGLVHRLMKRGIPIGWCFTILMVILFFFLAILQILTTQREGYRVAYSLATQVFSLTNNSVNAGIKNEIDPVLSAIQITADISLQSGVSSLIQTQSPTIVPLLNMLDRHSNIMAVNYGFKDGSFFSITTMHNPIVRENYKAPQGAVYCVWAITRSSTEPTQEYWEYLDADRHVIARVKKNSDYDPRTRAWYKKAMASPDLVMTQPYIFNTSKEAGVACSKKLGNGSGVFSVNIMLKNFENILQNEAFSPQGQLLLLDTQYRLLGAKPPVHIQSNRSPLQPVNAPADSLLGTLLVFFHEQQLPKEKPFTFRYQEKDYFTFISPVDVGHDNFLLISYAPVKDFIPFGKEFSQKIALYYLCILIFFLPVVIFFAHYLSSPLAALVQEFRHIRQLDLAGSIKVSTWIYEVRRLALALRVMKNTIRRHRVALLHNKISLEATVQQRTEELLHTCERAEAATSAKSAFLAMMSHEVRTPISGIIGMTELCLNTQPTEQQKHYLDRIHFAATNLVGIVNDALDFSKIEAGKLDIELVPVNLPVLINNIEQSIATIAAAKGLEFIVQLDPHIPHWIIGDSLRLAQVLHNLFSNAVKFTENGTVRLAVSQYGANQQPMLRFTAQDTGIGLSPEEQERLFIPYEQAEKSTARRFGGTGLGLAISLSLVRLMGGELTLKSQKNKGSTFTFSIPLHVSTDPHNATQMPEEDLPRSLWGARVLLVEDDEINQEIAKAQLEDLHMVVDVADNGKIACDMVLYEQAKQQSYALIFMDVQMPIMDGLTATRRLRARGVDTPIVALSANATQTDTETSIAAGMQDHIIKPFTRVMLVQALRQWLQPVG